MLTGGWLLSLSLGLDAKNQNKAGISTCSLSLSLLSSPFGGRSAVFCLLLRTACSGPCPASGTLQRVQRRLALRHAPSLPPLRGPRRRAQLAGAPAAVCPSAGGASHTLAGAAVCAEREWGQRLLFPVHCSPSSRLERARNVLSLVMLLFGGGVSLVFPRSGDSELNFVVYSGHNLNQAPSTR